MCLVLTFDLVKYLRFSCLVFTKHLNALSCATHWDPMLNILLKYFDTHCIFVLVEILFTKSSTICDRFLTNLILAGFVSPLPVKPRRGYWLFLHLSVSVCSQTVLQRFSFICWDIWFIFGIFLYIVDLQLKLHLASISIRFDSDTALWMFHYC